MRKQLLQQMHHQRQQLLQEQELRPLNQDDRLGKSNSSSSSTSFQQ
jgi:hypothetical protein